MNLQLGRLWRSITNESATKYPRPTSPSGWSWTRSPLRNDDRFKPTGRHERPLRVVSTSALKPGRDRAPTLNRRLFHSGVRPSRRRVMSTISEPVRAKGAGSEIRRLRAAAVERLHLAQEQAPLVAHTAQ